MSSHLVALAESAYYVNFDSVRYTLNVIFFVFIFKYICQVVCNIGYKFSPLLTVDSRNLAS